MENQNIIPKGTDFNNAEFVGTYFGVENVAEMKWPESTILPLAMFDENGKKILQDFKLPDGSAIKI